MVITFSVHLCKKQKNSHVLFPFTEFNHRVKSLINMKENFDIYLAFKKLICF